MKMKRMEMRDVSIGEYQFKIRPFGAKDALYIFGDVASILLPILGSVAVASDDKDAVEMEMFDGVDLDTESLTKALGRINGKALSKLVSELTIVLSASGAADSFSASLCRYITVVDVTSNILFESVEYGNYVQADKTIDQIVTSVDGWDSCINEIPPIKGRLTQKDSEARASYTNRVASRGTGTVNAIVSLLYSDVEGVTFAAGYQNDNDEKDAAGRPPHCIEIIVQGGLDEDVSDIIWKNKPGGIRAYGSHYAYATDINGIRQYVEFTRVKDVYLLLSVKVTSNDELDADFETRIKSLLMAENLLVGSPIRLQKFIRPIIENVSGVDYIEIRGILSEKQDIEDVEDGAMLTGAVPVSISQQPVVTMDGIRVVKA